MSKALQVLKLGLRSDNQKLLLQVTGNNLSNQDFKKAASHLNRKQASFFACVPEKDPNGKKLPEPVMLVETSADSLQTAEVEIRTAFR